MQALIDRHRLIDAVHPIGVVVAFLLLDHRHVVRAVPINLVGAGEAEGRLRAGFSRCHQNVHRAYGVDVKIHVGNGRGFVMRGLSGGVNDEIWTLDLEEIPHLLAIANIGGVMAVAGELLPQGLDVGQRRSAVAKEKLAHVVIDAGDFPALLGQQAHACRTDQTARACD